jgi:hypothetical protein
MSNSEQSRFVGGFEDFTFPQCGPCIHIGDHKTCDAFPDGIPDLLFFNVHDHRKPIAGDHGVLFEPRPGRQHPFDNPLYTRRCKDLLS